ncbi:Uncharacterized protein pbN1_05830 [Aromatoleum bremense]|nr:Uncharacterized protein pbN1_05830 [Aromatoleum bremense]
MSSRGSQAGEWRLPLRARMSVICMGLLHVDGYAAGSGGKNRVVPYSLSEDEETACPAGAQPHEY